MQHFPETCPRAIFLCVRSLRFCLCYFSLLQVPATRPLVYIARDFVTATSRSDMPLQHAAICLLVFRHLQALLLAMFQKTVLG